MSEKVIPGLKCDYSGMVAIMNVQRDLKLTDLEMLTICLGIATALASDNGMSKEDLIKSIPL